LAVGITTSVITIAGSSIDFGKEEKIAASIEQKRLNESVEKLMTDLVNA
jgi:hypothetical protein